MLARIIFYVQEWPLFYLSLSQLTFELQPHVAQQASPDDVPVNRDHLVRSA